MRYGRNERSGLRGARSVKGRVLVVEDNATFARPLHATLRVAGYDVVVAESAEAAECVLGRQAVDVVLSDVDLPGMDGVTLAGRHPQIPFVLMTGSPPERRAGATTHPPCLTKPLDLPRLFALLREAMEASGATPAVAVNQHSP